MDTTYVIALTRATMYSASMHWSMLWLFIGFVCAIVFWVPIVRQFTDGR